MIAIFKQKNPANIFVLLVFGLLLKLPMFLHPHIPLITGEESAFYSGILDWLQAAGNDAPVLYPTLAFFLLFLQAVLLTQFINIQRMMNRSNYFPGMAYLLVTSLFPDWNYFSAPLIVNTILLFILSGLFRIYGRDKARGTIYNIGLALGISASLFFPSLTFLVWILLALMVMRPFRLNEWALCLAGVTTPFYFYAIYLFITDQWSWQNILPRFTISLPVLLQSAWLAGSVFLITIPFLLGGYFVQDSLRRMLIHVRKGWSLVLLYLLGAIFIPFVNNSHTFENWVMAAIPFAAFHACTYLYANKKWLPQVIFWATVIFVVAYQYYGPGW